MNEWQQEATINYPSGSMPDKIKYEREIYKWLRKRNICEYHLTGTGSIAFKNEKDYTMFALRWA